MSRKARPRVAHTQPPQDGAGAVAEEGPGAPAVVAAQVDPGVGAAEVAAPAPAQVMKRPAAASKADAVEILPELAVRDLEDSNAVRCGKCLEPLPAALDGEELNKMGLPKGWTCTGRSANVYKCNKCNSTCAKMRQLNISPKSLDTFSPLEAKQWWEMAKGLGGKVLKQDLFIYI